MSFHGMAVSLEIELKACREALATARAEADRFHEALAVQEGKISQVLGKAIGYPRYCDDKKNFPDATPECGVCTGDSTAESLADEAAARIEKLIGHLDWIGWSSDGIAEAKRQLDEANRQRIEAQNAQENWQVIERAANDANWAEFVSPQVWLVLERIKSKCGRMLLKECADKSQSIVGLYDQLAAAEAERDEYRRKFIAAEQAATVAEQAQVIIGLQTELQDYKAAVHHMNAMIDEREKNNAELRAEVERLKGQVPSVDGEPVTEELLMSIGFDLYGATTWRRGQVSVWPTLFNGWRISIGGGNSLAYEWDKLLTKAKFMALLDALGIEAKGTRA